MNRVDEPDELRDRVTQFIARKAKRTGNVEYELYDLGSALNVASLASLSMELARLVIEHKAELVYRVVSPSGGGIGEWASIEDIPAVVEDRFNDFRELTVTPELIRPVYRFH